MARARGDDHARASAVLRACHHAPRLEEAAAMTLHDATTRLQLIPGIGP
ncbi:hypothetical protein [Streptomyces sp. NBC_00687]|nr:hypothetical protein [Streptomyces sp. NBC_00687]